MIVFYLNLVKRGFLRNKLFFLLNLLSLSIGIAAFWIVLLFVQYETSFDSWNLNAHRISRITTSLVTGGNFTKTALSNGFLSEMLLMQFPHVEEAVRFKRYEEKLTPSVLGREEQIRINDAFYADQNIFNVFSFHVLEGDASACLAEPNSIVLSASTARKLFGSATGLGESLTINNELYVVTAIMEDVPSNSDLKFDALLSMTTLESETIDWVYTFILFRNTRAKQTFQPELDFFTQTKISPQLAKEGVSISYTLEPLEDVHFVDSNLYDTPKGSRAYVYMFFFTGLFILIMAYLNQVNTSVIRSFSMSKQIGIQKILGASNGSFVLQFFIDGVFFSLLALLLAFIIGWFVVPLFAGFTGRPIHHIGLLTGRTIFVIIGVIVLLNAFGCVYPAFFTRSINVRDVSNAKAGKNSGIGTFSKMMLGFQFFIVLSMITSAIIIYRQVQFVNNASLGFNYKNVLVLELPENEVGAASGRMLRNKLKGESYVKGTAFCSSNSLPGQFSSVEVFDFLQDGAKNRKSISNITVDNDYLTLLEIPVVKGSAGLTATDTMRAAGILVNESFIKNTEWKEPVGGMVAIANTADKFRISGAVADFHFNSLHNPIVPMIIFQSERQPSYLLIKIDNLNEKQSAEKLKVLWQGVSDSPFEYFFLEQRLLEQYEYESSLLISLIVFTLIIFVICCFSLTSYGTYIVRQTMLDTAIRRILGASFGSIFTGLVKPFSIILASAFLIASPVTLFMMRHWLEIFVYHINPRAEDFIISLSISVTITVLILGYYSMKGINTNPIKVIRQQ